MAGPTGAGAGIVLAHSGISGTRGVAGASKLEEIVTVIGANISALGTELNGKGSEIGAPSSFATASSVMTSSSTAEERRPLWGSSRLDPCAAADVAAAAFKRPSPSAMVCSRKTSNAE